MMIGLTLALLMAPSSAFAPQRRMSFVRPTSPSVSLLKATSGPMACRPIGVGSATPKTVITNVDLEQVVETSDEWIQTRTGIASRRVLLHTESIRDLQLEASKAALDMAGCKPEDIDLVICATSSADDLFGDAPFIANALGCPTTTVAFDLTAACSGFLFGAVTAAKFLSAPTGDSTKALVIGADALSRWVDWDDRNSCILFGDGAGAMVLEKSSTSPGFLGYAAHSNGGGYSDLTCGYVNLLNVWVDVRAIVFLTRQNVCFLSYIGQERKVSTPGEGSMLSKGSYGRLHMNGKEVYKFATREVPTVLQEALRAAGMTVDDVDWLLLHQANIRIMETVANRLGIPMEKVIANLDKYGNTSAASIPLALDEAVRSGKVKKGDVIACAGFGAGLSWGAAIFKWG